jgi:hypothetical protein
MHQVGVEDGIAGAANHAASSFWPNSHVVSVLGSPGRLLSAGHSQFAKLELAKLA